MNNFFGLDIGSETIKILQVSGDKSKLHLESAGIAKNPVLGYISESDKEMLPLVETIVKLKKEAKISTDFVNVSLQERSVFTQTIEVPQMPEADLEQAIKWEAESVIPKPIAEVSFDWKVIPDEKTAKQGKMKILIVAAPLVLINGYMKVLKMAGLKPLSMESESLAILRALNQNLAGKNALVFNWGLKSAEIIIAQNSVFYLNRSLAATGESLSRAVSVGLGLDMVSAEEYKKTYGLRSDLEGKVGKSLEPQLENLTNEIKKAINFFEEKEQEKIKMMVLSGGSSLLYGAVEYFTKCLGLEVQASNPFISIEAPPQYAEFLKKNLPFFTVAAGLVMKRD